MKKTFIFLLLFILISVLFYSPSSTYNTDKKDITTIDNNTWVLDIPKIKLKRKISETDDVDHNIIVIKPSGFPDKDNTLILAAHSGSSRYSFFDDLYKLHIKDKVYLRHSNNVFRYELVNIYKQRKTGTINIYKDDNKVNLILVTCTNNDNTTQTIYVLELI